MTLSKEEVYNLQQLLGTILSSEDIPNKVFQASQSFTALSHDAVLDDDVDVFVAEQLSDFSTHIEGSVEDYTIDTTFVENLQVKIKRHLLHGE